MYRSMLLILGVGLIGLLTACAVGGPAATPTPDTPSPSADAPTQPASTGSQGAQQQTAAGQSVYQQDCSSCHGENLDGTHQGPPLSQSTLARFGDAGSLVAFVSSNMPLTAPGSLSSTQDYEVTAYILDHAGLLPAGEALTPQDAPNIELKPTAASPTPAAPAGTPSAAEEQTQAGQQVYNQVCSKCHGTDMGGSQVGPPINRSLLASFATAQDLVKFNSQEMPRDNPGSLSEQQYYDVTAYILRQLGILPAGEALTPQDAGTISVPLLTPTPSVTGTAQNEVVVVKVAEVPELGTFLTAADGYTVYSYDKDKAGQSNCTGACANEFPPVTVSQGVQPVAGPGVPGSVGVIKRPDGTDQVTYTDPPTYTQVPLYLYYGDTEPGETNANQYDDVWHIVSVSVPSATPTPATISATIQQGNAALGATVYMVSCAACHGLQGQGVDAPPLRNSTYVQNRGDEAVFETIANGRPRGGMPAWALANGGPLTDAEMADIVAYLHTLQGVPPLPAETPEPPEPTPTPLPPGAPTPEPARPSLPGGAGQAVNLTGDASRGQPEFGQYCAGCHGPQGVQGIPNPGSDDGSVPVLNPIDPTIASSDAKTFAANVDLFIQHGSVPEGPNPLLMMPIFGDSKMLTQQQIADITAYVLLLNGVK